MVDEPAHSIMARLATRHGEEIRSFSRRLGINLHDLARGHGIERLASLARTDGEIIKMATAKASGMGQSVCLHGEDLTWIDWKTHPRRACAVCLFTDREGSSLAGGAANYAAWHRSWWDVRCIRICPIHGCLLSGCCAECGEPMDWSGPAIDRCPQGHLLATSGVPNSFDPTVDRYLLDRLLSSVEKPGRAFLDQLSLGNAARILERLGEVELDGWAEKRLRKHDEALQLRHRTAGFQMTSDLERRFRSALDKVSQQAPEGRLGLIHSYGWIYRSWLGVPRGDQSGGRLLSILLAHAAQNGIISERELEQSVSGLSLKAASTQLRLGISTARRMIRTGSLAPVGSRPGVAFQIDANSLERMRRRLADLVDCQTAASTLGIGRNQFRSLVRAQIIVRDKDAEQLGLGQRFSMHHLESFLNKLRSRAEPSTCAQTDMVSLSSACRMTGVSLVDACSAILAGKLATGIRGSHGAGIASVNVAIDDMQCLVRPRSQPVTTVATALGIHPQAASGLLKTGAFGAPPNVSKKSLSAFRGKYAKPAELVSKSNRSGGAVIRHLSKASLPPAFGPPHCRQLFYPRRAAIRMLSAGDTAHFQ